MDELDSRFRSLTTGSYPFRGITIDDDDLFQGLTNRDHHRVVSFNMSGTHDVKGSSQMRTLLGASIVGMLAPKVLLVQEY